jgi:hypothetical protein
MTLNSRCPVAAEQLSLEGTDVPTKPLRLDAATCWRGLRGVAECREILAATSPKQSREAH